MILALRRRHPWMTMCIRMPGDYIDSKKRVMILALLIFNGAAVCALLVGTEQNLGYIQGNISVAIMAMIIGFPLPFLVTQMLTRETPGEFKVSFTALGIVAALPWLFWVVTLLMGEMETDFGLSLEDEDDAGGDDAANENRENEGEEEDDVKKDEEEDEHIVEPKNAASGLGLGIGLGMTLGYLFGTRETKRKKRKGEAAAFKSQINLNSSAPSIHEGKGGDYYVDSDRSSSDKRRRSEDDDSSRNRLFFKSDANFGETVYKAKNGSMRGRTETELAFIEVDEREILCCGRVVSREPSHPPYNLWVFWDFVAAGVCLTAITGCAFIVVVLAYQAVEDEGADWDIVSSTLLTWPQDIVVRACTILWLEAVLTAPCIYVFMPCFLACSCCACGSEDARVAAESEYTFCFDADKGVCKLDKNNFVTSTYDQAKTKGVRVGWRLVKLGDERVITKDDTIKALRRIHAMQRYFYATFDLTPTMKNSHILGTYSKEKLANILRDNVWAKGRRTRLKQAQTTA